MESTLVELVPNLASNTGILIRAYNFIGGDLREWQFNCERQSKPKCRASSGFRLQPNLSSIASDDLFADREADTAAGVGGITV